MTSAQALQQIIQGYSEQEIKTWPYQFDDVKSYMENNANPTPYIDLLATQRGIDRIALLNKIIAKIDAYIIASTTILGKQQKLIDQVNAATTIDQVNNINW